jgi:hypothetical protein
MVRFALVVLIGTVVICVGGGPAWGDNPPWPACDGGGQATQGQAAPGTFEPACTRPGPCAPDPTCAPAPCQCDHCRLHEQRPCRPLANVEIQRESPPPAPQAVQPQAFAAGPPSGVREGPARSVGIEGMSITFPELRLRLPSITLPTLFASQRNSRMMISPSEAPLVAQPVVPMPTPTLAAPVSGTPMTVVGPIGTPTVLQSPQAMQGPQYYVAPQTAAQPVNPQLGLLMAQEEVRRLQQQLDEIQRVQALCEQRKLQLNKDCERVIQQLRQAAAASNPSPGCEPTPACPEPLPQNAAPMPASPPPVPQCQPLTNRSPQLRVLPPVRTAYEPPLSSVQQSAMVDDGSARQNAMSWPGAR